jgi:hypothetical protein
MYVHEWNLIWPAEISNITLFLYDIPWKCERRTSCLFIYIQFSDKYKMSNVHIYANEVHDSSGAYCTYQSVSQYTKNVL